MWLLHAVPGLAAETRVALIIGNSDYANPNLKLTNPANDAAAMQRALKAAGFETIVRLNAKRVDFYRAVDEFSTKIGRDPHAVGLFYYAGHGVQAEGTNYLIPVDADIQSEADLDANAFDAGRVLRAMKTAQNEMNIVILDACRDNPLPKTRGIERGLARMDAPSGTFIAYAAAPGQSAQDGASGTNGVFTGELVKAMSEPGVPLEQMFKKVIAGVKADTHGGQQPWSEASIQGDFYFHAGEQAAVSHAPAAPIEPPAAAHAQSPDEIAAYKAA
ncbi:MAG TPA: caspase family protein, partial [Steroidobacteraceae bacterium]